ncbi:MAG: hypothetical protein GC154_20995 [bacterium]|nr:hypothetical protein [bacterium]
MDSKINNVVFFAAGICAFFGALLLAKTVCASCRTVQVGGNYVYSFDVVASPKCSEMDIDSFDLLPNAIRSAGDMLHNSQPEISNPDYDCTAPVYFRLDDFIVPTYPEMVSYNLTDYADSWADIMAWVVYTCERTDYARMIMIHEDTVYGGAYTLGWPPNSNCQGYCSDGLPWGIFFEGTFFWGCNAYSKAIIIAHEQCHTLQIGDAYYDCQYNVMSVDIWNGYHGLRSLQASRLISNGGCPTCALRDAGLLPNIHCDYYDGN